MSKTSFLFLYVLFSNFSLFGQDSLHKVVVNDKYNRFASKSEFNKYYFDLIPIEESPHLYHFRYWTDSGQFIDIFGNDSLKFKGVLINYIIKFGNTKRRGKKKVESDFYLVEKNNLNDSLASIIGKIFLSQKLHKIPTYTLIDNYNKHISCDAIDFQIKHKTHFYDKVYSCISAQKDTVKYVNIIKQVQEEISQVLKLEESESLFFDKLERGHSYHQGCFGCPSQYLFTDKQIELLNKDKPRRDYLKSIKDTINSHLENELNKLISIPTKLECSESYYLYFSKKGRFMRIKRSKHHRNNKQNRKCIRYIKKACKGLKINFINPKYEFYRGISFWDNKVRVFDKTVY